jgi:hypothetical protein
MTPAGEIIFAIGLLMRSRLDMALVHLFRIGGTEPQDDGTM